LLLQSEIIKYPKDRIKEKKKRKGERRKRSLGLPAKVGGDVFLLKVVKGWPR
jgi:hypothetical protein